MAEKPPDESENDGLAPMIDRPLPQEFKDE
jgi:hypothetical protein